MLPDHTAEQRARRDFVAESIDIYCSGTDKRLAALKRRYRDNKSAMAALRLTVADGDPAQAEFTERQLMHLLQSSGPIHSTCSSVTLLEDSTGRWKEMHAFPLMQHSDPSLPSTI